MIYRTCDVKYYNDIKYYKLESCIRQQPLICSKNDLPSVIISPYIYNETMYMWFNIVNDKKLIHRDNDLVCELDVKIRKYYYKKFDNYYKYMGTAIFLMNHNITCAKLNQFTKGICLEHLKKELEL